MGSCSRPSLASNIRQKPTKCLVSLATHGSEKSNNWLKKKRKPIPLRNLIHNITVSSFSVALREDQKWHFGSIAYAISARQTTRQQADISQ